MMIEDVTFGTRRNKSITRKMEATRRLFHALYEENLSDQVRLQAVKAAIRQGASIHALDRANSRNTPLHIAVYHGYKDILALLLAQPLIAVYAVNEQGHTPLDMARNKGDLGISQLLLEKGAKVRDDNGVIPLHSADIKGNTVVEREDHLKEVGGESLEAQQYVQQYSKSFQPKSRVRRQYNVDDDNLQLFALIGRYKKDAGLINNIKDLLNNDKANININNQDKDGDTFLHAAIKEGHKDIVNLLLEKQRIDATIKNYKDETPLDIAKLPGTPNGQEITNMLNTHLSTLAQPSRQQQVSVYSRAQFLEIDRRLTRFIEDFVVIYESYFSDYYERLVKRIPKEGKSAHLINGVLELGKGATESIEGVEKAAAVVSIGILQKIVSSVGVHRNRDELKILTEKLYEFKDHPIRIREILIRSGAEIFQKFESQFVQATSKDESKSWQRAIDKLAHDAVNRIIAYFRENSKEEFSLETLTKGVIIGASKRYKTTSGIPNIHTGHSIKAKDFKFATTEDFFAKVGLQDDNNYYYKNPSRLSGDKPSDYGFRLLFAWEEVDSNKYIKLQGAPSNAYGYLLTKENLASKQKEVLDKIDDNQKEEPLARILEQVKQDAEQNSKKLLKHIEDNVDEIKKYFDEIKQELSEISSIGKETRAIAKTDLEIDQEDLEVDKETLDIAKSIHSKVESLDGKLTKVLEIHAGNNVQKEAVWFNVKPPVTSFTGRTKELVDLHNAFQEIQDIQAARIVVISGLSGVGKSELAVQYAHNQYHQHDKQGSVIWINAGTPEALASSFRVLAKDKLKISLRDADGDDKDIQSIVGDVYDYFSGTISFFIFDQSKAYNDIERFLPLVLSPNNKPRVLITSTNTQRLAWENSRVAVKWVELSSFDMADAVKFVKNTLGIKDDAQDKDIEALAAALDRFPLLLESAVKDIKQSQFTVADYTGSIGLNPASHVDILSKIVAVALDKVNQESYGQEALKVAHIMAYLSPIGIEQESFLTLVNNNEVLLDSAIRLLMQHPIAQQGSVSMHELVQQVIRSRLQQDKAEEEKTLTQALSLFKDHMKDLDSIGHYIPHIISIWNYAIQYDKLIDGFIINDVINDTKNRSIKYLHLIAESSSYEVLNTILSKIKDPNILRKVINARDEHKKTLLHYAARGGNDKIVKLLIANKANVDTKDRLDHRPLHIAAKHGHLKAVEVLLDKDSNIINAKTSPKYQFTPLHLAAKNGYLDVVNALLGKNADVNARTKDTFTPLHLAAEGGYLEIVNILLEKKSQIDAENEYKNTALHLAAKNSHLEVVGGLLAQNANINAKDKGGFVPLHLAALNGNVGIVNKLLENSKININAQTTKGKTSLHLAAEQGYLKIVTVLVTKNADVDIVDQEGNLASDLAYEKQRLEVVNYISSVYTRTPATAGIAGQFYEIKLSMLLLLQGIIDKENRKISGFHLGTNVKKAGKFDDIVFDYKKEGVKKSKIIFLQIKHKDDPEKDKIGINNLLAESGDFSLKEYFASYLKIKQQFSKTKKVGHIFSGEFENSEFGIYTNALPASTLSTNNGIKEESIDQNDFLKISDSQSKYYQLEFDSGKKEAIVNALEGSSECRTLARELVMSISSGKWIDMRKDIFKSYHAVLAEKVIKKTNEKEGKLNDNFLDDENLSLEDKEFRKIFFEEAGKTFNKQGDELKQELQDKVIKLSDKFGVSDSNSNFRLPNDPVTEDDIKDFLSKFKLFASQPSEKDLEKIIKDKVKEEYNVEQQDIDSVFSTVKGQVEAWWQSEHNYLTEDYRYFQESARVFIKFDVKDPVLLFTGRQEKLQELHQTLQDGGEVVISQMASVTGLGGVGKSELARKYISEYKKDYDGNVIWINADNYLTISESFRRLAQNKLGINTKDINDKEKDINSIIQEVYAFFAKRHRKSLFVFDNAGKHKVLKEGDEGIDKFLPSGPDKPHVLITSRDQDWVSIAKLQLDVFTEEEAVAFIRKALKIEDGSQESEIKNLAEELQYLPLALQQAIAYIDNENRALGMHGKEKHTINSYLDLYKIKAKELLDKASGEMHDRYTATVRTTWEITIDKIKQEMGGAQASEVLNVIAYLAPDKIPTEELFSKLISNKGEWKRSIELLYQYSMANLDRGALNIHRLVQQVTRIKLKEQNREEEVLRNALGLLKNSVSSDNVDHAISAWDYAAGYTALIKEFIELPEGIIKNAHNRRWSGAKPLHYATERNHVNVVEFLLKEKDIDINAPSTSYYGRTPLHLAAEYGYIDIAKLLIEKKADLDAKDNERSTALHEAAFYNKLDIVTEIVNKIKKNKIDSQDSYDRTPLYRAAESGNLEIVKFFVSKGAQINKYKALAPFETTGVSGWTVLHVAAYRGHQEVVKFLIEKKADIDAKDSYGMPPFFRAKNLEIARLLIRDDNDNYLLAAAASHGDKNLVKELLDKDIKKVNVTPIIWTPLHLASGNGHLDVVEFLIEKGADIVHPASDGCTPLHLASGNGHLDVVEFLVDHYHHKEGNLKILKAVNEEGWTVLHAAAKNGHLDVLEYFIKKLGKEFNVNIADKKGTTLLHTAAFHGKYKVVDFLLHKEGIEINASDKYGARPLFSAALNNNLDIIELLLREDTKIDSDSEKVLGKIGITTLHIVAAYDELEMVKRLLDKDESLENAGENKGFTPLHAAALFDSSKVIKYLVEEKKVKTDALFMVSKIAKAFKKAKEDGIYGRGFIENMINFFSSFEFLEKKLDLTPGAISKILDYNNPLLPVGKNFLVGTIINLPFIKEKIKKQFQTIKTYVDKKKLGDLASPTTNENFIFFAIGNIQDKGADENHQTAYIKLNTYITKHLPDVQMEAVKQGLYLPAFESRKVKIDGKCAALTRLFSQSLWTSGDGSATDGQSTTHQQFLSNLQLSATIYERLASGQQISSREEAEVFAFSNLVHQIEEQLISPTSSLPPSLSHLKSYKPLNDLVHYISDLAGDFAIRLVTDNHVVAIYRVGDPYSYFDSNVALVTNLKNVNQLMQVVKKGIAVAGYKLPEEGFLVEHFDVSKANKALTDQQKAILTKPIQTERDLLTLQDESHGPIYIDGQEVSRVTLYDMGAKLHLEGSAPVLIHAEMHSKELTENLRAGKIKLTAREYLQQLKGNKKEVVSDLVAKISSLSFDGSINEVKDAQTIRDLVLSENGQKLNSYQLNKILKGPIDQSIKALPYYMEVANTKHWPNRLTNAAGRISMAKGLYDVAHAIRYGDIQGFLLGSGEISFSLFSQLIEDGIVKVTPQLIKQMKHGIFLSRGFAGVISSPFDIYDLISSSIELSKAAKGSKEWRDSLAGVVLSGSSVATAVAFTALGKPGAGTVVGLGIIIGQGLYSGASMVVEYKKYKLTTNQAFRLFWHTFALQLPPEDVQYLAARQDVVNGLVEQAWDFLQNNTQVAAYAMGLGEIRFVEEGRPRVKRFIAGSVSQQGVYVPKRKDAEAMMEAIIAKPKNVVVEPSAASIGMSNPSNEREGKELSRIVPLSPAAEAALLCLPTFTHRAYEYDLGKKALYSDSNSTIYHCNNAMILGRKNDSTEHPIMLFDLSLIHGDGLIVSSSNYRNQFNIAQGGMKIYGGNHTSNSFTLTDDHFFGRIIGGPENATNLLDASQLNSIGLAYENNILTTQEGQLIAEHIDHFIGRADKSEHIDCRDISQKMLVDSRGGSAADQDIVQHCNEVVVTAYTKVVNKDTKATFYIKPSPGHAEINGKGSILFAETALLQEATSMHYAAQTNSLSLQIKLKEEISQDQAINNATFTLAIDGYLDEQGKHNYVIVDRYGSVIEPLLPPHSSAVTHLNVKAATNLTNQIEVAQWYKEIAQTNGNHTIYGVVKDVRGHYHIFGSKNSDVIPLTNSVTLAQGNENGDLYSLIEGEKVNVSIDNYAQDKLLDLLYLPLPITQTEKRADDLEIRAGNATIAVKDYFKGDSYKHLAIIDQHKNSFVPWNDPLQSDAIEWIPFLHATENHHSFSLSPEQLQAHPTIMVDAELEAIRFYKDGQDLLFITPQPFIIQLKDFYKGTTEPFTFLFQNEEKLHSRQLAELAKIAINYQAEISNAYDTGFREYNMPVLNTTLYHNQQFINDTLHSVSDKQVGVLKFKEALKLEALAQGDDLLLRQGNATALIKHWDHPDHRISLLTFDTGELEIKDFDRFDLTQQSAMQALLNQAEIHHGLTKQLSKLDGEVVNGWKYILASHGLVDGIDLSNGLGLFSSKEEQQAFVEAYGELYSKEKLQQLFQHPQAVEALIWLMIKGYNALSLKGEGNHNAWEEIHSCFEPVMDKTTIDHFVSHLNEGHIVERVKRYLTRYKAMLQERIYGQLAVQGYVFPKTVEEEPLIHNVTDHSAHPRGRRSVDAANPLSMTEEAAYSNSAGPLSSPINRACNWVKRNIVAPVADFFTSAPKQERIGRMEPQHAFAAPPLDTHAHGEKQQKPTIAFPEVNNAFIDNGLTLTAYAAALYFKDKKGSKNRHVYAAKWKQAQNLVELEDQTTKAEKQFHSAMEKGQRAWETRDHAPKEQHSDDLSALEAIRYLFAQEEQSAEKEAYHTKPDSNRIASQLTHNMAAMDSDNMGHTGLAAPEATYEGLPHLRQNLSYYALDKSATMIS